MPEQFRARFTRALRLLALRLVLALIVVVVVLALIVVVLVPQILEHGSLLPVTQAFGPPGVPGAVKTLLSGTISDPDAVVNYRQGLCKVVGPPSRFG